MAQHIMTFEVENGITKAKIDGVYMGGGKAAQVEASEEQIKDVIEDTIKANPEMAGDEPNLEGLEVSGDKYAVPQGGSGGGSSIETIEVTVTNWGTLDDPVHTNLTQEQMEKLNNGALIKVIDGSSEWLPTICYPCVEIAEENTVAYFTWISNATSSSGMHSLFQYLVAVDFLNSILTPMLITYELDTARMNAITDANGNYRFTEGDGIPDTVNITSSYCKWSLSGTHLMVVLAGKYIVNSVADQTVLAQYEVPEFILDKIFPVWGDNIEMKQVFARLEDGTGYEDYFIFTKENGKLKIKQQAQYNHNDTYFRIQFDLLIDTE